MASDGKARGVRLFSAYLRCQTKAIPPDTWGEAAPLGTCKPQLSTGLMIIPCVRIVMLIATSCFSISVDSAGWAAIQQDKTGLGSRTVSQGILKQTKWTRRRSAKVYSIKRIVFHRLAITPFPPPATCLPASCRDQS